MSARALPSLSLRARLTLWYGVVLVVLLVAFAALIVWQQARIGTRRVDRELDAAIATLANVLGDEVTETANPAAAAAEARNTIAVPGRASAILDGQGRVLAADWNGLDIDRGTIDIATAAAWTVDAPAGAWRVHSAPMSFGGQPFVLLIAAPLVDLLHDNRSVREAMWVAIPLVLLLASAGGLWLGAAGLRPLTAMARRAEALAPIGTGDLGESDRRDELGQFARAFNGLVVRLRQALQTQRQFMADASHELRTPVSVIQSAADVTLAQEGRSEREYRGALTIVRAEAQRLGRLVDDMLVLARADAGGYPLRREHLYLNDVIAGCQRSAELLARDRGVAIHACVADDVAFWGDENLLRRMILNLLQNAVAYTRPGSAVGIDLSATAREVCIRIRDEGQGIPGPDQARIFDRFVQLDAARRTAGAGLGLPIARWIAEAHGGSLVLEESGTAGSIFRILLPAA